MGGYFFAFLVSHSCTLSSSAPVCDTCKVRVGLSVCRRCRLCLTSRFRSLEVRHRLWHKESMTALLSQHTHPATTWHNSPCRSAKPRVVSSLMMTHAACAREKK